MPQWPLLHPKIASDCYHSETFIADFTLGLPSWSTTYISSGSGISANGSTTTQSNNAVDGSLIKLQAPTFTSPAIQTIAEMRAGGIEFNTSFAKAVYLEAIGVCAYNGARTILGLYNSDSTQYGILSAKRDMLDGTTARIDLEAKNNASIKTVNIYDTGVVPKDYSGASGLTNMDIGLFIDFERKLYQGHFDYHWVKTSDPTVIPSSGTILTPKLRCILTDGTKSNSYITCKRLKMTIYS